jgi:predicted DNA-binding transcriptional regulator AlpA
MPQVELITVTADRLEEIIKIAMREGAREVLKAMPAPANEEQYLSAADASRLLGVTRRTIYNYVEAEKISQQFIKGQPRYLKSELMKLKKVPEASR